MKQVVLVSGRLEGSNLGGAMATVKNAVGRLQLPSSVRVEYGGTYQEQQRSFATWPGFWFWRWLLVFGVLLTEFRNFSAPLAILEAPCFRCRCCPRAFDHRH